MKPIYLLLVIVTFLVACVLSKFHPLSDEYIAEINRKQSTWKAGRNFDINDWEKVKRMSSGAFISPMSLRKAKTYVHKEDQPIPEFYDFRESYPKCNSVKDIYDQAQCGSCWAFCAVEVMSDRICIKSQQKKNVVVSAQDALTCCSGCGSCRRGDPYGVYQMWANQGISTGGHYNNTAEGCKPYFLPECGMNCPSTTADTPACEKTCADSNLNYESELTFGEPDMPIFREAKQIQLEMLKNGPVSTIFLIPLDFPNYQSGIYQHTTDVHIGSHCLKFVGWGVENGTKYWIVANSWGKLWGENGFFRIIRGINESGIEGAVFAASPLLDLSFVQH